MTGADDALWSLRLLVYAAAAGQVMTTCYLMALAFRHRRAIDRLARMLGAVVVMSGGTVKHLERALETEDFSAHM